MNVDGPVIVVGVDPGARATGIVVVDHSGHPGQLSYRAELVTSTTVTRPLDDGPLVKVPRAYLVDVVATVTAAVRDHAAALLAIEDVNAPSWRHAGKTKPVDPAGIIATAIVLGALRGRAWQLPVVDVAPGGNGRRLPLHAYPDPLCTGGKGHDKRRHERSAFDVAAQAPALHRFDTLNRKA